MTNYESVEPDKVKDIFAEAFAVNKETGEVLKCFKLHVGFAFFVEMDAAMQGENGSISPRLIRKKILIGQRFLLIRRFWFGIEIQRQSVEDIFVN